MSERRQRPERATDRPTGPAYAVDRCSRGSGSDSSTARAGGTTSASRPGKSFHTNRGGLSHDDIIGREEGFTLTSTSGGEYLVFRPLLSEFVVSMPRGAAVVYPKDAAQIVAMADIFPGATRRRGRRRLRGADLLAAARRGPHRARVLLRAPRGVRRRGPPQRRPVLRRRSTRPGRSRSGDLVECAARRARRPAAWTGSCWTCSRPGSASTWWPTRWSPAASSSRTSRRPPSSARIVETLRAHGEFTEPQPWETLVRDWHVEGLAVRPGPHDERAHRVPGHRPPDGPGQRRPGEEAPSGARCLRGRLRAGPDPAGLPPAGCR